VQPSSGEYHQRVGATSTTRLFASSIAIVSGLYAISSSAVAMMRAPMMTEVSAALGIGGWIMLGVGIMVLGHGIILLTPLAGFLARTSGPLMMLWAGIMLVDQALLAALPGWGIPGSRMDSGMSSSMTSGMGWDAGMVAIAVLMLASGLIMSSHGSSDGGM